MTTDFRRLPYKRLTLFSTWNDVYVGVSLVCIYASFTTSGWSSLLFTFIPFFLSEFIILCITYAPIFRDFVDKRYRSRVLDVELKKIFHSIPADERENDKPCSGYREINRLKYLLNDIAFTVPAAGMGSAELEHVDQIQFNYVTLWVSRQDMKDFLKAFTDQYGPTSGSSKFDLKKSEAMTLHLNKHIRAVEERMQALSMAVAQTCQDIKISNEHGSWRPLRDRLKQLASENIWVVIEDATARTLYENRLKHIGLSSRGMQRTGFRLRLAWLSFVSRLNRSRRYKAREREVQWLIDRVSDRAPDDAARHADLKGFDHLKRLIDRAAINAPIADISRRQNESVAIARLNYLTLWLAELMMRDKVAEWQIPHATEQDQGPNASPTSGSADEPSRLNERAELEKSISILHEWLQLISAALVDCANATSFLLNQSHMTPERGHFQPLHDALHAVDSLNDACTLVHESVRSKMEEMRQEHMNSRRKRNLARVH